MKEAGTELKREALLLLLRLCGIAILCTLIFTKVFLLMRVSGDEMYPSLKDGDLILAFRLQKGYEKNDIVVYGYKGKNAVSRVAARENDVVMLDESGTLSVNGTEQSPVFAQATYPGDTLSYPYRVEESSVFVLGDYRSAAHDSREQGSVALEQVKGKVITLLRRRGL